MRRAARRDVIESDVIQALERIGVTVERVSQPGLGDLLAHRADTGFKMIEVKSGKQGKLTNAQRATHQRLPIVVIRSVEEGLALFGVTENPRRSAR